MSTDVICIWLMKCLLEQLLVDPVGIASSAHSQLPGVAFLQENDNNVQKEDVAPQSDSQLLGREAALLRANSDILSNVLQQGKKSADAASSKEFMMPVAQIIQQRLIEDSIEPAQDKDFVVMVTHVNDATVTSESDQTNSGKCLLSNDCDEEVKSDMLLSVPNNASCSDSSPQQHHEKILKQINKMREIGNESKRCSTNIKCNGGYLKLEESGITNILEGSSVARWYHLESPEFEVDGLESSRSSRIDYVLDEW
ncbi:hypothetical protein BHM03_00016528 [Ensete ventricosum]|nr:hypothetical protein BHM03_00016528 [Ensete ventricosum]